MNFYLLLVAILAFSTTIDVSEAVKCNKRTDSTQDSTEKDSDTADCTGTSKCVSYFDNSLKNIGECKDGGCTHNDLKSLICNECTAASDNCNVRSLIRKCYERTDATGATGEGTPKGCDKKMKDAKCVSYYDASGNNLGKCLGGGCSNYGISTGSLHCKDCTADNCNVKLLIQKCYKRNAGTTCGDGTSTNCATTMANPKCVSYFDADGKNLGECKDGGCGNQTNCKECTGDNCNVRSLIGKCHVRTAKTQAKEEGASTFCTKAMKAPTCVAYTEGGKNLAKCNDGGCTNDLKKSNPDCKACTTYNCNVRSIVTKTAAAATKSSVGWQTGIMAASACVLVLMKPF